MKLQLELPIKIPMMKVDINFHLAPKIAEPVATTESGNKEAAVQNAVEINTKTAQNASPKHKRNQKKTSMHHKKRNWRETVSAQNLKRK